MPITKAEERRRHVDTEVSVRLRTDLSGVPVPSPIPRGESRPCFTSGRSNPNRPVHRVERDWESQVTIVCLIPDGTICDIEIIKPCLFGMWLVQRSRCSGIGQCTEEGQHHADAPVESWFNAHKVHRERITRLGSLDIEWAGLRVKVPEIQLLGGCPLPLFREATGKAIQSRRRYHGARFNLSLCFNSTESISELSRVNICSNIKGKSFHEICAFLCWFRNMFLTTSYSGT